jgi:DNA-binding CsgD family transcriptional regulator
LPEQAGQVPASNEDTLVRANLIVDALSRLTTRERQCLELRAEGHTYQEIGERLGTSAKSVSVYLVRGLRKLRFGTGHEKPSRAGRTRGRIKPTAAAALQGSKVSA